MTLLLTSLKYHFLFLLSNKLKKNNATVSYVKWSYLPDVDKRLPVSSRACVRSVRADVPPEM